MNKPRHRQRKWRGFDKEAIRFACPHKAEERQQSKCKVVEISPPPLTDSGIEPDAVYPHTFPDLAGIKLASITIEDAPHRIIGHCSYDLDVMPETPQLAN